MKLEEIIKQMGFEEGQKICVSLAGAGGKTTGLLELSRAWAEQGFQVLAGTTTHIQTPEILGVPGLVGAEEEEILRSMKEHGWVLAGEKSEASEKMQGLSEKTWNGVKEKADRIVLEADGAKKFPVKVPDKGEPVILEETTHILIFAGLSALGKPLCQVCHRLSRALEILGGEPEQILTGDRLGKLLEEGYAGRLRAEFPGRKMAVVLNQTDQAENAAEILKQVEKELSVPVFLRDPIKEIQVIYLAAGFSRRFGENKLLWELEGKPLYKHLLERLNGLKKEGKIHSLTVVTQYEEIEKQTACMGLPAVKNPDSSQGISSSLKLGLKAAEKQKSRGASTFYCFFVADQPYLRKETAEKFFAAFLESSKGIGCVSFGGVPGNPVIFGEQYKKELLDLKGDVGGKKVLKAHLQDVFFYETEEEKELKDCDYQDSI